MQRAPLCASRERETGCKSVVTIDETAKTAHIGLGQYAADQHAYKYDHVFGPASTQGEVHSSHSLHVR